MFWVNFLHIYQPPNQKPYWIKRVAKESYRKLIAGFLKNPKAKLVLNINAVLTELLEKNGCQDVINGLIKLAKRGQIEFTDTTKYHTFLPLLPESEIVRQIQLNRETNQKYFGKVYKPIGFFPTEMGYSRKVGEIAAKLGYQWIILEELAYSGKLGEIDRQTIYQLKGVKNFNVFFRDREISFRLLSAQVGVSVFSSKMLIEFLGKKIKKYEYLITAMDGETFGHHRPGLEQMLFDLYKVKEIKSLTLSDLPKYFKKRKKVEPLPSSWALMKKDIEQKTPFSRWKNKKNKIHQMQWELTNLAISLVNKLNTRVKNYQRIRKALDKALRSDQYWWASAQPWWSIEMIENGARELKEVIEMVPGVSKKNKQRVQELYQKIIFLGFKWQRTGKVEELSQEADEDITQRITQEMPYIPLREFNKILNNLEKQMQESAKNLEYERAAQIRNRIKELKDKKEQITKR